MMPVVRKNLILKEPGSPPLATAKRASRKRATQSNLKNFGGAFLRGFQDRRVSCETQLQQPTFLESTDAISNLVSPLLTRPRWTFWARKRIASSLKPCDINDAGKILV